jgi:hypothetical protein
MSSISIRDQQGKALVTSDLSGAGLGRYLKGAATLRGGAALVQALTQSVAELDGSRELDLTLDADVPIGKASELTLTGGASASIGVHTAGTTVAPASDVHAPVVVPNGTAYVSFTIEAVLRAGASGGRGSLGFGFQAGTALRYATFHPVDIVGTDTSLGDALQALVGTAVYPADATDLEQLPVGAFVSLVGTGELSFSGAATLNSATTLLATPGVKLVGQATVTAGASLTVGADWSMNGALELRISKSSASVARITYFRRRGRALEVSASARAGVGAQRNGKDLLTTLLRAISPDPEADLIGLVNAGLDDPTIESIAQAVAASIDRSLTLAAQVAVSSRRDDEALVDVELHGRVGTVAAAAEAGGPFRILAHAERQVARRRTTWRINLLGVLNAGGLREFLRDSHVVFDPVSGALTAADTVSAKRIRSRSHPLQSDDGKLRQVLFESLLVTAAYQAGRALGSTVSLAAEQVYLEQRSRTSPADLTEYYRLLIALGLCDEAERDRQLALAIEPGASTFTVQNRFDTAACDALFLDADGEPRPESHYERIARLALLVFLPASDPTRAFRHDVLASEPAWARIRSAGGALASVLPDHIAHNQARLALVRSDVTTVLWWATAMSTAARELVSMRTFLAGRDAASLAGNAEFRKRRDRFTKSLAGVVATTEAHLGLPWDVIAMDAAAARRGTLEALVVSSQFAARYTDVDAEASGPAGAAERSVSRGMDVEGVALAATTDAAAAAPPWTPAQLAVFDRHVVNLRGGTLSTSGSFGSTIEQVTRIFTEHIPAYVAAQEAAGERPRVLFFAHGGLIGEREGLRPVLERRRFWELNGVYPVYFVWETGLRETLRDILTAEVSAREARAAGELTDLAIERGARRGGKRIWDEMKKSATQAAADGGGAALVATLTAKLWKQTGGNIELHALGHSAGAIFHAHFLPVLVAQKPTGVPRVSVRTLHLLAPAVTTGLFKQALLPLTGSGKPITQLAHYTMTDALEQADPSTRPYGKSLLYLVSRSFEDAVPTPILGLEASLKRDLQLIRFFGLAGTEKVADMVFSQTGPNVPLTARSDSTTHGGFDNDVATMTSMIRRVLDVSDTAPVVDYFEDPADGPAAAAAGALPASGTSRGALSEPRAVKKVANRKK